MAAVSRRALRGPHFIPPRPCDPNRRARVPKAAGRRAGGHAFGVTAAIRCPGRYRGCSPGWVWEAATHISAIEDFLPPRRIVDFSSSGVSSARNFWSIFRDKVQIHSHG